MGVRGLLLPSPTHHPTVPVGHSAASALCCCPTSAVINENSWVLLQLLGMWDGGNALATAVPVPSSLMFCPHTTKGRSKRAPAFLTLTLTLVLLPPRPAPFPPPSLHPPAVVHHAVNAIIDKLLDVRGARPGKQVNLVSCVWVEPCGGNFVVARMLFLPPCRA